MTSTIEQARCLGHDMADLAADKQGGIWRAHAISAFVIYATKHKNFTTEDVRTANPEITNNGDLRAWGSIATWAKKNLVVEFGGFVPVVSSRGGAKTLWRSLICEVQS